VDEQVLGDEKVAPLAKGGVAFLFDQISVISSKKAPFNKVCDRIVCEDAG